MATTSSASTTIRAAGSDATIAADATLPERIGPFVVLSRLGQGGMGLVYCAQQENPRRLIALKVMRAASTSDEARKRFEYESRALARLHHPAIAQIYDVGSFTTALGESVPYLAMELVEGGRPLDEYARASSLAWTERLQLFIKILDGVHHGHQRGVIHRDLKPDNILVDTEGCPKIIDFGVARLRRESADEESLRTQTGAWMGTPQYMSPEQFGAEDDIDVRSDVYSLGVLLFQLLCGQLPHDFAGQSVLQAAYLVRSTPPRRLANVDARWRGDLDTIVSKAIATDREQRYVAASALAADLRRFLTHEPISARPPSAVYQLRLFARRNRVVVAALGGVFAAALVGMAVSARFAYLAEQRAQEQQLQAYRANMLACGLAIDSGQMNAARAQLASAPPTLRGWEWNHLASRVDVEISSREFVSGTHQASLVLDPSGERIAHATPDGSVEMWRVADWTQLGTLRAPQESVHDVSFTASDQLLIISTNDSGGQFSATRFDLTSSRVTANFAYTGHILNPRAAAFRDGRRLALSTGTDGLIVVDIESGRFEAQRLLEDLHGITVLELDHDDRQLAVELNTGDVLVLDANTLETRHILTRPRAHATAFAFDDTGAQLAVASEDSKVSIWNLAMGVDTPTHVFDGHGGEVLSVVFLPGGDRIASTSNDCTVRVTELRAPERSLVLRGHSSAVDVVAAFPDAETIATIDRAGILKLWDLGVADEPLVFRGHASYVNPLALSPDGERLVSGGWDGLSLEFGGVRWWDVRTGANIASWERAHFVQRLEYSPDGQWIVVGSNHGAVVLNASTGAQASELWVGEGYPECVHFSASGRHVAYCAGGSAHVFATDGFKAVTVLNDINCNSSEGHFLAVRRGETTFELIDLDSLQPRASFEAPPGAVSIDDGFRRAVVLDGTDAFVANIGGEVTARVVAEKTFCAALNPDGTRLMLGTADGAIHVIDVEARMEVAQLLGHSGYVYDIDFSRDGRAFYSSSGDGTVRVWETHNVAERLTNRRERRTTVGRIGAELERLEQMSKGVEQAFIASVESSFQGREREIALQVALGRLTRARLND